MSVKAFLGVPVYTMDGQFSVHEAIIVVGDRVQFVGSAADALRKFPEAQKIELREGCILPGFIDAHLHLQEFSLLFSDLDLSAEKHRDGLLEKVREAADQIAHTTGKNVIAVASSALAYYNGETYKRVLTDLLGELHPSHICIAHSSRGADFAPGLAVRLNAACITGVAKITTKGKQILFSRMIWGGKIACEVRSATATTILTMQPGFFSGKTMKEDIPGEVEYRKIVVSSQRSRTISIERGSTGDVDLSEASVIISAGRDWRARESGAGSSPCRIYTPCNGVRFASDHRHGLVGS